MASTSRSERDPDRPRKAPAAAPGPEREAERPKKSAAGAGTAPVGRAGKNMAEEDVERPARTARGGGGATRSSGMGLGARVGLFTGLATLLLMAVLVLPSLGSGKENVDTGFNEAGAATVSMLAAVDPAVWTGKTIAVVKEYDKTRKNLEKLFGAAGRDWFDDQVKSITKVPKDTDEDELREQQERAKRFEAGREALDKGDATQPEAGVAGKNALLRALPKIGSFDVAGTWVRDGHADSGKFLASTVLDGTPIAADFNAKQPVGPSGAFFVDGSIGGSPVRIFLKRIGNDGVGKQTLYAALFRNALPPASGNMLGILLLVLAPLLVGLIGYAVANGNAQKIKGLAREIEKLGTSGDPTRTLRVQGAEATAVARAVERMVGNLEFRQQHAPAAAEGAALGDLDEIVERERKVAREIHDALINKHPPRLSDFEVEHLFKPGFEIGGDHFEYFRIDDEHLGVMLLDTNVRGIPAALVIASARSYVRAAAPGNLSPAAVLKQVNKHLAGELPPGRHVTAVYAVIDTAAGKATMASAGHLPVLVFRQASGKVAKINPAGIAMGLDVGPVFDRELQEGDVPLGPGDRLVLYTDGALRITNETGEEFGEQRFYAAVTREAPKNSQAFVNFVGSAIDQFHLTTPQNDDVTISTVKRLR